MTGPTLGVESSFKTPCEKPDADGVAAVAPARRALSWAETKQLLARLQPPATDFAFKLFTAMPPAWWFVALGVGLWRGKK